LFLFSVRNGYQYQFAPLFTPDSSLLLFFSFLSFFCFFLSLFLLLLLQPPGMLVHRIAGTPVKERTVKKKTRILSCVAKEATFLLLTLTYPSSSAFSHSFFSFLFCFLSQRPSRSFCVLKVTDLLLQGCFKDENGGGDGDGDGDGGAAGKSQGSNSHSSNDDNKKKKEANHGNRRRKRELSTLGIYGSSSRNDGGDGSGGGGGGDNNNNKFNKAQKELGGVVHRLDRGTSGVMVLAKTNEVMMVTMMMMVM